MRLRSVLVVALAFVLGASAALGFRAFVDRRGEPAPEVDTLPVVVAVIDIARGGTITSDLIKMRETPKALVPEGALTKPEEAIGRAVASPLVKNEMVLDAKLSPKGAGRISSMIPPGMRAVTIGTPRAEAGAAGFVRPGDKVDVLLTPDDSGPHAGGGSTTTLLQGSKSSPSTSASTSRPRPSPPPETSAPSPCSSPPRKRTSSHWDGKRGRSTSPGAARTMNSTGGAYRATTGAAARSRRRGARRSRGCWAP